MLKKILKHYRTDFSTCVKELFLEKLEDLRGIGLIKRMIYETNPENYRSAKELDSLYNDEK